MDLNSCEEQVDAETGVWRKFLIVTDHKIELYPQKDEMKYKIPLV